jgi:hypothetical protein
MDDRHGKHNRSWCGRRRRRRCIVRRRGGRCFRRRRHNGGGAVQCSAVVAVAGEGMMMMMMTLFGYESNQMCFYILYKYIFYICLYMIYVYVCLYINIYNIERSSICLFGYDNHHQQPRRWSSVICQLFGHLSRLDGHNGDIHIAVVLDGRRTVVPVLRYCVRTDRIGIQHFTNNLLEDL